MPTDDPRAAAIEAAAAAMADDWNPDRDPVLTAMFRDYAASAVTAAVPHLTAGLRALHFPSAPEKHVCHECGWLWPCSTARALDALERGGER